MAREQLDVVFFRIPLCGKCKQVASNLAVVKKDRPQMKLEVYTLPSHIDLARKNGILTAPALLIKGRPYKGILSVSEILAALDATK